MTNEQATKLISQRAEELANCVSFKGLLMNKFAPGQVKEVQEYTMQIAIATLFGN